VEGRLRGAVTATLRRPIRRQPEPTAAVSPIPGDLEAVSPRHPGSLYRVPPRDRNYPGRTRRALSRRRLGISHAWRLGARLASLARWTRDQPVHVLSADWRVRLPAGFGRTDLRTRAHRDVPPRQGERLRPLLGTR